MTQLILTSISSGNGPPLFLFPHSTHDWEEVPWVRRNAIRQMFGGLLPYNSLHEDILDVMGTPWRKEHRRGLGMRGVVDVKTHTTFHGLLKHECLAITRLIHA